MRSEAAIPAIAVLVDPSLVDQLWTESSAAANGLSRDGLSEILATAGYPHNFGQPLGVTPSLSQQIVFFRSLRLADLVLAQACALGIERAWQRFLVLYREPLTRAAIAITGSETTGRDLADQLYAELYGLTARDVPRHSPLSSYRGRGSLIGWLRTTLAQRHVDHHRRTWREEPLQQQSSPDGSAVDSDPPAASSEPVPSPTQLSALAHAISNALTQRPPEDRFLLSCYYLDGRTLLEISRILRVHEATVSRRVHRITVGLRQNLLRSLQKSGLSKRAAEEALATDPRDLSGTIDGVSDFGLNLKKLLQTSPPEPFQEKADL